MRTPAATDLYDGTWINPQALEEGEDTVVVERLLAALGVRRGR